jgi:tubulin-specific chaperone A
VDLVLSFLIQAGEELRFIDVSDNNESSNLKYLINVDDRLDYARKPRPEFFHLATFTSDLNLLRKMLKRTAKPITLRDIKIKTGVVKRYIVMTRTSQELVMYQKEYETQKAHIAKLIATNADIHDIRKQNEVLDETSMMLPDCKQRLVKAFKELQDMLVLHDNVGNPSDQ